MRAARQCPLCRTGMAEFTVDELVLDRCESCEGVWFDAKELRDYGRRMGLGRFRRHGGKSKASADPNLPCPSCADASLTPTKKEIAMYGCSSCDGRFIGGARMKVLERRYIDRVMAEGPSVAPVSAGTGLSRLLHALFE